jgi:hypothetical protein
MTDKHVCFLVFSEGQKNGKTNQPLIQMSMATYISHDIIN